jgi:hypothetical protein
MNKIIGNECRESSEFWHCYLNSESNSKDEFCFKHCKSHNCKIRIDLRNSLIDFKIFIKKNHITLSKLEAMISIIVYEKYLKENNIKR